MGKPSKTSLRRCLHNHFNSVGSSEVTRIVRYRKVYPSEMSFQQIFIIYYGDSLKEIEEQVREYERTHSVELIELLTIEEAVKRDEKREAESKICMGD